MEIPRVLVSSTPVYTIQSTDWTTKRYDGPDEMQSVWGGDSYHDDVKREVDDQLCYGLQAFKVTQIYSELKANSVYSVNTLWCEYSMYTLCILYIYSLHTLYRIHISYFKSGILYSADYKVWYLQMQHSTNTQTYTLSDSNSEYTFWFIFEIPL